MSELEFYRDGVAVTNSLVSDVNAQSSGIRNLEKKFACVFSLVNSNLITDFASELLQTEAIFVKAILFNKTPAVNWFTNWHQDKNFCLSQKINMPDWRIFREKNGNYHVQPPESVINSC